MKNSIVRTIFCVTLSLSAYAVPSFAQSTLFTYQGKLTDAGSPASGSYQMQFKLFDALAGGGQIESTITDVPVTATQGIFTVKLDFGANALSGANRWLEIAVRRNSGESYVTLSPREQIASSPYSVRTLSAASADVATNALNLGGVAANQFVQTNDTRLTDARNPLPNSGNYIQNNPASQQPTSNFSISGNGAVGARLGIGTQNPAHQLGIASPGPSQPFWSSNGWYGSVELSNVGAIAWRPNASGQSFGIGQTGGGLHFLRSSSPPGTVGSPAVPEMLIADNGLIGIGTTDPQLGKLHVNNSSGTGIYGFGGPANAYGVRGDSTNGWGVYGTSTNSAGVVGISRPWYGVYGESDFQAVHGKSVTGAGVVGVSTTWAGVYGESNSGNAVWGKSTGTGPAMVAEGNAIQSSNKSGWVKALLFVNEDGTIPRCYNGVSGTRVPPCGFTVSHSSTGVYTVFLGFTNPNPFAVASVADGSSSYPSLVIEADRVGVTIWGNTTLIDNSFVLVVF